MVKHGKEFDSAEIVNVTKPGGVVGTMFGLDAATPEGLAILRSLFGGSDNMWLGDVLYVDQRYVNDVIDLVGTSVKFVRSDR
jgi:hypothetical protein